MGKISLNSKITESGEKPLLSLLIPAYNEEKIMEATLNSVLQFLGEKEYLWEVLVIDDGSQDKTAQIVQKYERKGVQLIKFPNNRGKGAALRSGFLAAKGDYVIYTDADLSVSTMNIDEFLRILEEESDVAIGSRRIKGAQINVHQPWIRETMGRFFTFLSRVVLWMNVADFTCGFKGFKAEAAQKIFSHAVIDRWVYDSEILFLAKKFKYKMTQVPVVWTNRTDTRVVLKSVVFESLKDLLLIRLNDLLGKYR